MKRFLSATAAATMAVATTLAGAEAPSLQQQVRGALAGLHEEATQSRFNRLVFSGKVTLDQYMLHLNQRLATFEVLEDRLSRPGVPAPLKGFFGPAERNIVAHLRRDVGLQSGERVDRTLLPGQTRQYLARLDAMDDYEIGIVAYIMCGGSAFGAHDVARKLKSDLGTDAVRGLSVYQFDDYRQMVGRLNRVTDPTIQKRMVSAARQFMIAQTKLNNGPEF